MTQIDYEIFEGRAYAVGCTECDGEGVRINASPATDGYVMICNRVFDLKVGVCRPDIRALPDGDLEVSVFTGGRLIRADALHKCGRTLRLSIPGAERVRELEADVLSLKREIRSLYKEVEQIRAEIDGASVL